MNRNGKSKTMRAFEKTSLDKKKSEKLTQTFLCLTKPFIFAITDTKTDSALSNFVYQIYQYLLFKYTDIIYICIDFVYIKFYEHTAT